MFVGISGTVSLEAFDEIFYCAVPEQVFGIYQF
jgi:hypothetical protein